jgi:SAM-dependent methyltransferase
MKTDTLYRTQKWSPDPPSGFQQNGRKSGQLSSLIGGGAVATRGLIPRHLFGLAVALIGGAYVTHNLIQYCRRTTGGLAQTNRQPTQFWRRMVPMLVHQAKRITKRVLTKDAYRKIREELLEWNEHPGIDWEHFCSIRRLHPIRYNFGLGAGKSPARYYIDNFVAEHAGDVHGRVLEIGDNHYTHQFGGEHVLRSDVLNVRPNIPGTTIVADLSCAEHIPSEIFDCIIFTQTLYCIYDVQAAIQTLWRILKPGGVLLVTLPGICQIDRDGMDKWGDYWRFTTLSAQSLFTEAFSDNYTEVKAHGNVLTAMALLFGILSKELRQEELDYYDPNYEVIITVRAVKPHSREEMKNYEDELIQSPRETVR